jgi:NCAIR mutase (PurE)-related protein
LREWRRVGREEVKMKAKNLEKILRELKEGKIELSEAMERLQDLPYADLGFAKVDIHRQLRRGYPEVIFCERKTPEQVLEIVKCVDEAGQNVLATRASRELYEYLSKEVNGLDYYEKARIIHKQKGAVTQKEGTIMVICAGTSDIGVAEEAAVTAEVMGNFVERAYDVGVAGIHRLLDARERIHKARVIVVVAGMEGALASVVSGIVASPVIAVPTSVGYGASFNGLAALLAMLNCCSPGVSVVNIDNGFGAGYLANLINSL